MNKAMQSANFEGDILRALILFNAETTSPDALATMTADLMTARTQVRLVRDANATAPDFDDVQYLILAGSPPPFSPTLQAVVDARCADGMCTLTEPDVERLVWFRSQSAARKLG